MSLIVLSIDVHESARGCVARSATSAPASNAPLSVMIGPKRETRTSIETLVFARVTGLTTSIVSDRTVRGSQFPSTLYVFVAGSTLEGEKE